MARYRVDVRVGLRPGVLDPQGQAVAGALRALGFSGVGDVRVGRWIRLDLEAPSEDEARRQAEDMCRRLLANPVIEEFAYDVSAAGPAPGEAAGRQAPGALGSPLNPRAAARGLGPAEAVQPPPGLGPGGVPPEPPGGKGPLPGSPGLPPVPPGGRRRGGR